MLYVTKIIFSSKAMNHQMNQMMSSCSQLKLTKGFLCLFLRLLQHWDITQTKIRVISTLLFVLFGCLLFVALPAAIFKHIEGWSALESLYFVVITLTTIGFGDFVAGTNTNLKDQIKGQHRQSF